MRRDMTARDSILIWLQEVGAVRVAPKGSPFIVNGKKMEVDVDLWKAVCTSKGMWPIVEELSLLLDDRLDHFSDYNGIPYVGGAGPEAALLAAGLAAHRGQRRQHVRIFNTNTDESSLNLTGWLPSEDLPGPVFFLEPVIDNAERCIGYIDEIENRGCTISGILAVAEVLEAERVTLHEKYCVDCAFTLEELKDPLGNG